MLFSVIYIFYQKGRSFKPSKFRGLNISLLLAKLVIIGSKAFKFNSFTIRNLEDLGMLAVSQLNIRRKVVVETKTKLNPKFYFHYDKTGVYGKFYKIPLLLPQPSYFIKL